MAKIKDDDLITLLKDRLSNLDVDMSLLRRSGRVEKLHHDIASASGLKDAFIGECLEFESGAKGICWNIQEHTIDILITKAASQVKAGDKVYRTEKLYKTQVGESLLGRVVNGLGEPIDGLGQLSNTEDAVLEAEAPEIIARRSVTTPLQTGIKLIDSLIPIGRGQRQLLIGDRQIGKTTLALDIILHQKNVNKEATSEKDKVYCVYVAIGRRASSVANIVRLLKQHDALEYTCIVTASAADTAAQQYLAPYVGTTIAEYFRNKGLNSLIVYDDLTNHAVAYRELCLLMRRPPGREAYPSDIFFLHAKLLERSAQLSADFGGGSLTSLPVVETLAGDLSSYIATNIISITDGQLLLDNNLFLSGIKPAINTAYSVSRIGNAAQNKVLKNASAAVKLELAHYFDILKFNRFIAEVDKATKRVLERGARLVEIFKQKENMPCTPFQQLLIITAATHGYLDEIPVSSISTYEEQLLANSSMKLSQLEYDVNVAGQFSAEQFTLLDNFLSEFTKGFKSKNSLSLIEEVKEK